jgi:ABC-2 type transport system ATP-binding protein
MIETKQLRKQYGSVVALTDLDLKVEKGVIFGYVGPNGAGKTTTIRILCGLMAPTAGSVHIAGVDVVHRPEQVRSIVGYMPDYLTPYEGMRVWEYLDFFGAAYRIPRKERRNRVEAVLELTGAGAMRDYYVETLSHGMRQRLGVARALVHDPDVLILDEPTNGLDPRARVEMRQLFTRLKDLGKTTLISSHILPELASVCDIVGFMDQGNRLRALLFRGTNWSAAAASTTYYASNLRRVTKRWR